MLVTLRLQMKEIFLLLRIPPRHPKGRRQPSPLTKKFLIIKGRANPPPGKNQQPSPSPQIFLQIPQHRLRQIRHIRQNHRLIITQPYPSHLPCRHRFRLNIILLPLLHRHRHQRVPQIKDLALPRLHPRIPVHQQNTNLPNHPRRHRPLVIRRIPIRWHMRRHRVMPRIPKLHV